MVASAGFRSWQISTVDASVSGNEDQNRAVIEANHFLVIRTPSCHGKARSSCRPIDMCRTT